MTKYGELRDKRWGERPREPGKHQLALPNTEFCAAPMMVLEICRPLAARLTLLSTP